MSRRARRITGETRSSPENPQVPVSASNFLQFFGLSADSAAGIHVTIEAALGVPAVWAAVNFLSSTLASLPIHLYRRKASGKEKVTGPLASLLHDAVNDETTSYLWRKSLFWAVMTGGRHCTFIERAASGRVINLWPLDPSKTTVKRKGGRTFYEYRDGSKTVTYGAAEVIDIVFALKDDGLKHYSPVTQNADIIGLAIAVTRYGSKFFMNGGVPPFAITGNFQSSGAMKRAGDDLQQTVTEAAKDRRLALILPNGLTIAPIGGDPEKSQMVELKRLLVEEMARIWSLPPVFVQDLTHGTFTNTEQQDLHLVKHTLHSWVQQFEQQLNLKIFGRSSNSQFVEMDLDGLLRGDFKTRMEAFAQSVNSAGMTPNEVRAMENRPPLPGGDRLYIQGATVPLEAAGQAAPAPTSGAPNNAA